MKKTDEFATVMHRPSIHDTVEGLNGAASMFAEVTSSCITVLILSLSLRYPLIVPVALVFLLLLPLLLL